MKTHKPLHILLVQQSPAIGGAETYMHNLAQEWVRMGHILSGLLYGDSFVQLMRKQLNNCVLLPIRFDIIGNYRGLVKSLFLFPGIFLHALLRIRKIHTEFPIDVILVSGFNDKCIATLLGLILNIHVVWIEYGDLGPSVRKHMYIPGVLYRLLQRIPKAVITPSQSTVKSLVKDGRIDSHKIHVVPCGIKIPQEHTHSSSNNHFTIGCVSRLTPEKGQEYLIKAMPSIVKSIPEARCLIIGEGSDLHRLQECAKALCVENYIDFTGFVEDVDRYYRKMDVFVFPTIWELEGFGLVAVEAMARQIPVVASSVNSVEEIIKDVGILVRPGNVEDISDSVKKLYKNAKLRKTLMQRAYTKAFKEYNITHQAQKIIDILKA